MTERPVAAAAANGMYSLAVRGILPSLVHCRAVSSRCALPFAMDRNPSYGRSRRVSHARRPAQLLRQAEGGWAGACGLSGWQHHGDQRLAAYDARLVPDAVS